MRPSNNMENKSPSDAFWRVQLVCMKVQAHSYLEPQLENNQDQKPLTQIEIRYDIFNHLGVIEILQFQISPWRENRQRDKCVIKNKVLRKVFSN